ncbi:Dehydrogenase reductase SDR member 13, variant 2 [Entomophthora muscae]|uniref:Dehydrogenase reductase SDR member 13, variant 2 n=1 Tax=Entomophthora muscae TaxID=34485 RepID=A0ACC2T6Y4_9FUNG|nr:Dehydrogenase reductase SDR member 13, variant 2 [Entomophthora muscae]
MNAKVYLACRNSEKANVAIEDIKETTGNSQLEFLELNLEKISSVREFCSKFKRTEPVLDILINNAGLIQIDRNKSEDGFEKTLQCNYISHLYLTYLLLPSLKKAQCARVVNVASNAFKVGTFDLENIHGTKEGVPFKTTSFYATSKLYNIMSTKALASRLEKYNILINSTHPGFVSTEIWKKDDFKAKWYYPILIPFITIAAYLFSRSPSYAAITSLHPAVDPSVTDSGNYYDCCRKVDLKRYFSDSDCDSLLEKTFQLLDLDVDSI